MFHYKFLPIYFTDIVKSQLRNPSLPPTDYFCQLNLNNPFIFSDIPKMQLFFQHFNGFVNRLYVA